MRIIPSNIDVPSSERASARRLNRVGRVGLCAIAGLLMLFAVACGGGGGGDSDGGGASGAATRPSNLTCIAPDRPLTATSGGGSSSGSGELSGVALERTFVVSSFDNTMALIQHPTNDARWYVVMQGGTIDTFLESDPSGTRQTVVTVDVLTAGEMGLLGMAFHPNFSSNGLMFLSYVRAPSGGEVGVGVSAIGRYVSSNNGLSFREDQVSGEHEILTLEQPADNHNGGGLAFGPNDGFLYASFGDGGGANDAFGNGQDANTLFGTIIRIDVTNNSYRVPNSNPFEGSSAGADEVWAYGLRNPWRFSFDQETGDL